MGVAVCLPETAATPISGGARRSLPSRAAAAVPQQPGRPARPARRPARRQRFGSKSSATRRADADRSDRSSEPDCIFPCFTATQSTVKRLELRQLRDSRCSSHGEEAQHDASASVGGRGHPRRARHAGTDCGHPPSHAHRRPRNPRRRRDPRQRPSGAPGGRSGRAEAGVQCDPRRAVRGAAGVRHQRSENHGDREPERHPQNRGESRGRRRQVGHERRAELRRPRALRQHDHPGAGRWQHGVHPGGHEAAGARRHAQVLLDHAGHAAGARPLPPPPPPPHPLSALHTRPAAAAV
eukprot:COSAG06_NODE_2449_length_6862_cov_2.084726_4_plen_295_part_00